MVGLITSRIQTLLSDLRKGRSLVLEKNHVVILGWSSKIFSIINELVKANSNQDRSCIVILANKDKVEMQDEINEKVDNRGKTKIICRTGDPIDLNDLEIVNHHHARSIILVSSDNDKSDAENIKGILAIVNHPNRREELYHIVAEIKTSNNREVANIIGGDELTLAISSEIIARIAVQTCLHAGLSAVYNKLLDFDHVDIYFNEVPFFYYREFKQILMAYEEITPIGIQRLNGIVLINPRMNTKIKEGDKIIFIAEDDDVLPPADLSPKPIEYPYLNQGKAQVKDLPRRILILGWNRQGPTIIREMDNYVVKGSQVCIVATEVESITEEVKFIEPIYNLNISYHYGDITNRRILNQMQVQEFNHVMILSYSDRMTVQEADAHTLVTLMHLRDIKHQKQGSFTIISEMLDIKNQILAEVARPDDFIISDHIISLIVSQLAEKKELNFVFEELFDSHGSEFYLKPVSLYINHLHNVNFYTVMEAASLRQEVAIGYRRNCDGGDSKKGNGVVLNPPKSELITFAQEDKIIVLAENSS
ncbi:MAG: potassium transporter TrkA [Bacteroidia bacterium]|nr:potassium transporter TrkA [Bacteroidia bacterium]